MRQLALPIRPAASPSFDNFVVGANAELLAHLQRLAAAETRTHACLWGQAGSGRSHLLRAAVAAALATGSRACHIEAHEIDAPLDLPADSLLAVDDVEQLSAEGQVKLFNLINAARESGLRLLVSAAVPPVRLALREDLRTRLGALLVFEVKPLSDEDKAQTLACHARLRGMRIEADVIGYLLHHVHRDLPSLMAVLDALDTASLEQKRHVTLPLLREVLAGLEGV